MEISIIVPTYNRLEMLKKVLGDLNKQTYDLSNVEVLVIDDCSDVSPYSVVKKLKVRYKLRFYRMSKNSGQGQVRNKAIKLARGKYLLFLGDDMIPKENLLEEHMKLHKKYNGIAVLGRVFWHPEIRNEFMNYIERIQFHYHTIKDKNNVKLHFYTSNISLEKSWFEGEEYSSEFRNYGLEDLEIGYRLEKKGLRVVYNSGAVVYHFHKYTFEQFCDRMRKVGRSAVIFVRLHPELKKKYIPRYLLFEIYRMGSYVLSNEFFGRVNKKIYWYSNFVWEYLKGVEEELGSCGESGEFDG